MTRREYGSGSVYQRTSDQRWAGTIEAGWNANGTRRRITVTAKTRPQVLRKLRDKRLALEQGTGTQAGDSRLTVRTWALEWLEMKQGELRPKAYRAVESPTKKWVIPTIGHIRLVDLTPSDLRAVAAAQRKAGLKSSTANATHRAMLTMLRKAAKEGKTVPTPVLNAEGPKMAVSDRRAMTVEEGLACIAQAYQLDHGTRWVSALLYGLRQGESLGLTWDAFDWDAGECGEFRIEWQLQALPYIDRKDKRRGFKIPDGFECRHLVDAWHLVRPKSKAGFRVAPLIPSVRRALLEWREVAPENPWGLVWPAATGRPANVKRDEEEWYALQATVGVSHPTSPRAYYVHECRNLAATLLLESGVPEHVVTDLLGHSTVATSLRYRTRRREPLYDALTRLGERLQLGD